jgi:hypothetical protein
MQNSYVKLIVIALVSLSIFGCIIPPIQSNDTSNSTVNYSLKTIEELESQFGCTLGVWNETTINDLIIWNCARDLYELEQAGISNAWIYEMDAHPMGAYAVSYIVYDGTQYTEIKKPDELKQFFIPLEDENGALVYTYLHEGLNFVTSVSEAPLAGSSHAEKTTNGFTVTILHEDWALCPCYGGFTKSIYQVSEDGDVIWESSEDIYSYQEDCIC